MHTGLHFDTRSYRYGYKESTTPNNDRFAIFSQESLILDILGALVPYCSPHLHSCIKKNSLLVLITNNNNCKLKFICILLIESWSMLKNVGCIKEAKSTELHFTTKNKLKRATYYIISNHSLVAIFKTLGSALLTITKNNMLLIDFTYHSFSSFLGGYNFLHSQWTRLN